ncbi:unnamed protein product [Albugo candida]|uniref:Peptidase A1 domain-containing protein n=1 Tax=Albugo candida TaxID=65357 RepID=A0A024GTV9_9STRA|nr:unnamed protein product [Albugo candida]|eukprot:CCI50381.1 unnamed protein product [Albugo candida]
MKSRFLRTLGLAVGVFLAHEPSVIAIHVRLIQAKSARSTEFKRSMLLKIEPRVEFNTNGAPIKFDNCEKTIFDLTLVIENGPIPKTELVWTKTPRVILPFLLHKFHPEDSFSKSNQVETTEILSYKQNSETYYIGWRLNWKSLNILAKGIGFNHYPAPSLALDGYISQRFGQYTYEWVKGKGPILKFGESQEFQRIHMRFPKKVMLCTQVQFFHSHQSCQGVDFQLHHEATKIPPEYFNRIGYKFRDLLHLVNGRYQGNCQTLIPHILKINSQLNLYLGLKLTWYTYGKTMALEFNPAQSIMQSGDICTLLLENSKVKNEWKLGSSFLRAVDIFLYLTRDSSKNYFKMIQKNSE